MSIPLSALVNNVQGGYKEEGENLVEKVEKEKEEKIEREKKRMDLFLSENSFDSISVIMSESKSKSKSVAKS